MNMEVWIINMFVCMFALNLESYAFRLGMSPKKATVGESITLSCITMSTTLNFKRNNNNVCVIIGTGKNGSCSLDGSYVTKYIYTCDKTHNTYNITIPGSEVEKLHKSQWKCGFPFKEEESNTLQIYVNVPVRLVTLKPTYEDGEMTIVTANEVQSIECYTNAIRPQATMQWYLSGKNITSSSSTETKRCGNNCNDDIVVSTSILNYTFTKSDQGKLLNCTASNVEDYMTVSSVLKHVEVYYGPSSITLLPSKQSYLVREKDSLGPITCNSTCNPSCTHTWTGPGISTMEQSFMIHQITRNQTGSFYCESGNDVTRLRKQVNITVQYGAEIIDLTISGGSFIVTEHSDILLSCTAVGEPLPNLSWYFTNQYHSIRLQTQSSSDHSTFEIASSSCERTGRYSCTAANSIFPSNSKAVNLNITCAPRLNISCSTSNWTEVQLDTETTINVCWISNPAPVVTWTILSEGNGTVNYSIVELMPTLFNFVLKTRFTSEATVLYKITASNSYGRSTPVIFTVVVNDTLVQSQNISQPGNKIATISLAVGLPFMVLVICSVILGVLKCRKQKSKQNGDQEHNISSAASNSGYTSEMNLPLYAKAQKTGKGSDQYMKNAHNHDNAVPIYAEVHKRKPGTCQNVQDVSGLYSVVQKEKNKSTNVKGSNKPLTNDKENHNTTDTGLVYIEVDFKDNKKGTKFVIREPTERTEYGEIDFTKKADTLTIDEDDL